MTLPNWTARSYLAPNMMVLYRAVCDALATALAIDIELQQAEVDSLDDALMQDHQIDLAFICGLPMTRLYREDPSQVALLFAPVMTAPRYQNRPIYFSDFIVRGDSPYQQLEDLRGKIFGYNDSGSNSGFYLPSYYLMTEGYAGRFFGEARRTGAHLHSIQQVIDGTIDCAAIDSTVLEQAIRENADIADAIRILDSTTACPIPPIMLTNRIEQQALERIPTIFSEPSPDLRDAMTSVGVARFARVSFSDYAVVGDMFDAVVQADFRLAEKFTE